MSIDAEAAAAALAHVATCEDCQLWLTAASAEVTA